MSTPYVMSPERPDDWQDRAACVGAQDDYWFAPDAERGDRRKARAHTAKAICATCPVQRPCHEAAMTIKPHEGIWAGVQHGIGVGRKTLQAARERFVREVAEGKCREVEP